ncbi:MAG: Stage V sporulation protein D [Chloroflexi bacterium]|nr:Stage V sporulation protein D [Chloroflexota bacterium]
MKISYNWRYTFIGFIFALVGILIIGQMIRLQIALEPEDYLSPKTMGEPEQAASRRGLIVDRNGKLLAGNVTSYRVTVSVLDLKRMAASYKYADIEEINQIFEVAIDVFEIADEETLELLRSSPYPDRDSIPVAQFTTKEKVERFLDHIEIIRQDWPEPNEDNSEGEDDTEPPLVELVDCQPIVGIYCEPRFTRVYPENFLASNVLGFVARSDNRGHLGVESEHDATLRGDDRTVKALWDPYKADQAPYPNHGSSLVLTIDSVLQAEVEDILDSSLAENGSQAGTIIVMDPQTGDIYAMASAPRADVNEYWREEYAHIINNVDNVFNYAIKAYEPGSVSKVLTMAAALDAGVVDPDTVFLDTGSFSIGGITIRNWDGRAWGPQTMIECLEHSLNVCLAWVGSQLGAEQLYTYFQDFGFGQSTGVGLANESPGIVKNYLSSDWHKSELGTNSFGQGIEITPIQMMKAVSAVANGGEMVNPRIVQAVIDHGDYYKAPITSAGYPITQETAQTLTNMLMQSIKGESYKAALVPGYSVAGKTGTGEIFVPGEGYTSNLTNASFIGWGPVDDPHFMIYVWFNKPTSSIWGSLVAAPVFRQVAERVILRLDIPPDNVRLALQEDT